MDRKQTLQLDDRILRLAVDESPSSIIITDSEGRIEFVNPRLCELTGYARDELLGQTPGILKSGRTSQEAYQILWTTLRSGRQWSGTFCNRKKNGELYWEAARIFPVTDAERRITHFLGIKEDITELKRMELELAHSGKLEWLARLASGIAHDFNNLLTSIVGFGMPVQKALEGTRMGDDLGRVLSAAERATELARSLYALGSRTTARPQRLELNGSIVSMRPLLSHLLGPDIRCEFHPGEFVEEIIFDPVELQQLVINLLACRLESSSVGRTIRITTARAKINQQQARRFSWITAGLFLTIEIRDPFFAGPGGDPAEPARHGGFPLPAAIRILRNNGGFLSIDEGEGIGACSTIYLPVARAEVSAGLGELARNAACATPGMPVLLVEDDSMVANWLCQVLRSGGYVVLLAGSAEEAFEMLGDGSSIPSIVITDITLPGMNGIAMLESLREVSPHLKAVCMTGSSPPENLPDDTAMLQKPFSPAELLECVGALERRPLGTVLVVDDDDGIRELIRRTLERTGYAVVTLADGTGVEEELASHSFDLVVTDLVMPQREGLEVIRAVRRLHPDLPIVATSGAFGGYYLEVARKLGAEWILPKPLSPDELIGCVREILSRRTESQPCH